MNNTKRLPDAYAKNIDSNLYRLLQIANLLFTDTKCDLISISESRDLYNVSGKTLDYYGEMLGESRNGLTDEQYRTKILNRIGRYISGSDCNSFINSVSQMLGIEQSDISVSEGKMSVTINGLTMQILDNSGYKSHEIEEMIKGLMPVGVEINRPMYSGTLLILNENDKTGFSPENNYPVLFPAWYRGQQELWNYRDVGLSGNGKVPDSWAATAWGTKSEGTYEGGTLGILSGEDE